MQDSLEAAPANKTPAGTAAAPAASRAVWFNSSPRATQDLAVTQAPNDTAADPGSGAQAAEQDASCAEAAPAAAEVHAEGTAAPEPVFEAAGGEAGDDAVADTVLLETQDKAEEIQAAEPKTGTEEVTANGEEAAPHDISPCAGKENQQQQTPPTAKAEGKGSAGKEKRQSGSADGCVILGA